jgi:DNA recombination protein RmuC
MQITIDIFFILLSLCTVLLCAIFIAVIVLLIRKQKAGNAWEINLLQNQLLSLNKTLDNKLSENNQSLNKNMTESLKNSTNIADTSNKNIEAITKKLTELWETNKQIQDIGNRLEWLESILKNPKRRGNLWEYFLRELLENVFNPDQYQLQYTMSSWIVDAALFIGDKIIPIDSKFPQENYEKLVNSEDEFTTKKYSGELKKDIKNRIDETAKYILPEESTTDFAFMLIPAEWVYYDIFINKLWDITPSKLIEYWFSKKVIICSPSWFYAYLQTVLQWMKSLQIEAQAKEIQKYVLKLQKDMRSYEEVFDKLWNSLSTTVNHYNTGKKRLEIIDKDILKINPEALEDKYTLDTVDNPNIT